MPIFRRRQPFRRARITWALAGCLMALARRDWATAATCLLDAVRLLGKAAVADGKTTAVEPIYRAAGASRLLITATDPDIES